MSENEKPQLAPISDLKAKMMEKLKAKQQERERAEREERIRRQEEIDNYYKAASLDAQSAQGDHAQLDTARHGPRAPTGGLLMPTQWWGAELEALAEAMPPEDVKALNERMDMLANADGNHQIIDASQRLQSLFKTKPGLTSLINPIMMRAFVLRMQEIRSLNQSVAKQRAGTKVANAKAEASLTALLDDL